MERTWLIGDSGGTGTDWCMVTPDGERTYFSGESYHPSRFSETFFDRMSLYWKEKQLPADTVVRFYGAGCSVAQNQRKVKDHFRSLGFDDVEADSDLLGACRGLLGDKPGWAGILGTGSVLAEYDGKQVTRIAGGFGYLIGDEGSGFAFGKKLLARYLNHDLSPSLAEKLRSLLGDRSQVLQQVYGPDGRQWIAKLAAEAGNDPEVAMLHHENLALFAELYLPKEDSLNQEICFCGSYAFYNSEILSDILGSRGWRLAKNVRRPIGCITDHTIKATL